MQAADLAALHARCFTDAPRPWAAAEFDGLLAQKDCHLIAIEAGFLLWLKAGPEAELLTICVDVAARRAGIARRLMQQFHAQLLMHRVEAAFLEVSAENSPARALYRNVGWSNAGLRKDYYRKADGTRVDALVMQFAPCAA